jgi:hypothetical protein
MLIYPPFLPRHAVDSTAISSVACETSEREKKDYSDGANTLYKNLAALPIERDN